MESTKSFTEHAPSSASLASGIAPVIDEWILHPDPPTRIATQEASLIVSEQEAGFVERQLEKIAPSPSSVLLADPDDRLIERVVLVEFKRCPHGLKTALGESKALQQCRQALDDAGFNWKLPNGDMVFVSPESYRPTMQALTDETTRFRVIVAETIEYLVEESIATVGKGAHSKTRDVFRVDVCSSDFGSASNLLAEDFVEVDCEIVEKRTFLDIMRPLRNTVSVTQSS